MKSLKYLNKYLLKYKYRLVLGIIFIIISNIFVIYPPQIIREAFNIINEEINPNSNEIDKELTFTLLRDYVQDMPLNKTLLFFGALVLILAILKGLFTFFTRQTVIIMSRLIEYDLKNEIYHHYQVLDQSFYKANNTGDIMNRISEDVSKVRMYLGPGIMYSINLVVLFILVISTMISISPRLTFYSLLPLPALAILIYYVSNTINKKSETVQAELSDITTISQESFSGIRILKSFVRELNTQKQFDKSANRYKFKALDLIRIEATFMPIMLLLIGLSTILTIYVGGQEVIASKNNPEVNKITTGNIAEFIIYVNLLTWPVTAIGWVTSLIQRAAASQKRINNFLQVAPQIVNNTKEVHNLEGSLQFDHVSFSYPNSGTKAVNNLSFKLERGKTLAIIGKTGSGKSTVANLICRIMDPDSGAININGTDIKNINLDELRSAIGYVPQEVFLFSDSITNNIGFGLKRDEITIEAVEKAAQDAVIYDSIIEFPKKFETKLGERGITLSGGQKQRISIARAIIKNPEILIFDDCLSAVDTETEAKILQNLKKHMQQKTTVIISHRISSVQNADEILVMDKGSIVESGNHESLIQKNGIYAELYQIQSMKEQNLTA